MAFAKHPLTRAQSKEAIGIIFKALGGIKYSDKLIQSRKLKWTHHDLKKVLTVSKELDALGIDHNVIDNAWTLTALSIHVPREYDVRGALAGLVNPNRIKKRKPKLSDYCTYGNEQEIIKILRPFLRNGDEKLTANEIADKVKERWVKAFCN